MGLMVCLHIHDGDSGLAKSERKKKKGGNGEAPLGKATSSSLSSKPPIVWKNLGILWITGRMRSFWLPFIACGHVMASAWLHENCKKMQVLAFTDVWCSLKSGQHTHTINWCEHIHTLKLKVTSEMFALVFSSFPDGTSCWHECLHFHFSGFGP